MIWVYLLGLVSVSLLGILVALFPYRLATLPVILIGIKIPSFFFAILINGMFLLSYYGKGLLSGVQTIGAVSLASIGTILYKNKGKVLEKPAEMKRIPYEIIVLCIFGLFLSLSLLWSDANNYGLFKVQGFWLGIFIPFIFIYIYLGKNHKKLNVITNISLVFAIIAAIILLIENRGFSFGGRTTIESVNTIWSSRYIGVGLIISYYNCFVNTKVNYKRYRLLWISITILLFLAIIVNGSRGPLIAVVLSIIFIEVFLVKRTIGFYKRIIRNIFMILLVICFLFLLFNKLPRFNNMMNDANIIERVEFFSSTTDDFVEKPWTGWGVGGFAIALNGNDVRVYPHNIIFEIGIELGLVGLFIFFGIFIYLFKDKKYLLKSDNGRLWTTLFLFLFVSSLFSGDLFGNAALWIPLAVMVYLRRFNKYLLH